MCIVLFTKFQREGEEKVSLADAKRKKKEKQLKNANKTKNSSIDSKKGGSSDSNQDNFTKINLRVGIIESVKFHDSAETLYIETINLGEEDGPRQIVSGLRLHYPDMESLIGRKVIVVANLKKANIKSVASNGMVLCGVDRETGATELVEPPSDAEIGERVFVEGFEGDFFSPSQEKKKKAWKKLQPQLGTNDKSFCVWEEKKLMTKSGPLTCASLTNAMLK
jgi:aminoacyl tRNA synthase complex-interacting multifunctional protein 1